MDRMTQVDDLLGYLRGLAARGIHYSQSDAPTVAGIPARCDPDHSNVADCSGFGCAGFRHIGLAIPKPCMVSGEMYRWCADAGTLMPFAEAVLRPGSMIFRGWRGIDHIAFVDSPGRQIAAHGVHANPQVGVANIGPQPGWTAYGGWPPGLTDTQWPPVVPTHTIKEFTRMPFMARYPGGAGVYVLDPGSHTKWGVKDQKTIDLLALTGMANGRNDDGSTNELDKGFMDSFRLVP